VAVISPAASRFMNGVPFTTAITGFPPRPSTSSNVTFDVTLGVPGRGVPLEAVQPGRIGSPANGSGPGRAGPTTRNSMQSPSGFVGLTTPAGSAASLRMTLEPIGSPAKSMITSARSAGAIRMLEIGCGALSGPSSTPIWVIGGAVAPRGGVRPRL